MAGLALSFDVANPILTAAVLRISSNIANSPSSSVSMSLGSSVPVYPKSSAFTNTLGVAESTKLTSIL